jgi:outer membrane lipoprotein carrier protein
MSVLRPFALLFGVVFSALVVAAPVDELDARWQGLKAFEGQFTQTQRDHDGTVLSEGAGTLALARPGKFYWAYTSPYVQTIVANGQTVWVHDPDLKQVTRRPADAALAGTPASLLASGDSLGKGFDVLALPPTDESPKGAQGWRLTPQTADSEFDRIDVWLRGSVPVLLTFSDPLGGTTDVRFDDIKINPRFARDRFEFTPPRGHTVIGEN